MNSSRKRADRLTTWKILALMGSLILAPTVWSAGGDLQWEDQVDVAGGRDSASSIATLGGRAFVAGSVTNSDGNSDFLIRAYDSSTGALLWEDQVDSAGFNDSASDVAVAGERTFVVGTVKAASLGNDYLVRAYDVSSGNLVWEDQLDVFGNNDFANAVAVAGGRAFVVGIALNPVSKFTLPNFEILVRAYDFSTGTLLWNDQYDVAGGDDQGLQIVASGSKVAITGIGQNESGDFDLLVRTYDAITGALLWEDQVDQDGGDDAGYSMAMGGGHVLVSGIAGAADCDLFANTGNCDFSVRAYDATTGTLLWEERLDLAGGNDESWDIAMRGGRAFAVGFGTNAAGNADLLVRAYDAKTGMLHWQDQIDTAAGGDDTAYAVALSNKQVFVAGQQATDASCVFFFGGNCDFAVRAYDARSGALAWADQRPSVGGNDLAYAIAASGVRVFSVGRVTNANGDLDFFVRAYD